MKILQAHKFLYRKAGAETYVLDLAQLLVEYGHEVRVWGTDHNAPHPPLNLRGGDRQLLVHYLNFGQREGSWRDIRKFGHMVWSREAARKFEQVLKTWRPEVIHIHNIYHHISPAILPVAARCGVPVVMTVHDYHLINPNYALYDHGEICERQGLRAIAHRCAKNSFTASLADVFEWQAHHGMRIYEKHVAKFIAPTEFVKQKLAQGGMDGGKIEVVTLPVSSQSSVYSSQPNNYVLYAGRLTEEKGIYTVLELAKRLPEIKFKIAGDGPELRNLELGIRNYELGNVELLGFLENEKLQPWIAGARLVLVPSLWQELSPYAVLEAMAAGKVVVASRIGGIPELIKDGQTGFLIPSPDPTAVGSPSPRGRGEGEGQWVDKVEQIYYNEALLKQVGGAAQNYVKQAHDPRKHYEKIMAIYGRVISD